MEERNSPDLKWIQKYGNIVKYHGLFKPSLSQIQNQEITLNHVYEYIKPPKCWLMVLNCW
ncbi:17825_t:CDS:2 [Rhizophagus irregularis]|nr:17825_t:CDS:2 [Rhizophagus irregularis]